MRAQITAALLNNNYDPQISELVQPLTQACYKKHDTNI